MAQSEVMSSYWRGFRDGLPFIAVVAPFATLFGVLSMESGLSVFETVAFSVVVIAGSAQFAALQLLNDNAPLLVVILSALTVNLRMSMYSASLTPYLGPLPLWKRITAAYFLVDITYAASVQDYDKRPQESVAQKFAYFMGVATPVCPLWYLFTLIGALVGEAIPSGGGLDFALPIAFIAMVAPTLRTTAHMGAAISAALLALCLYWMPFNLGLITAALAGMAVGAELERRGWA
ncbi:Inner membrane protein YgaZ [Pelagimonas phthalicica]|uniref:Inner membrane protein YgaZ n=1 Tax=Pelagimonas phthalicica TaxID=1037362 RepID=A0A238J6K3_9RHOB|nr:MULTISPECIES: AzlC family ABC transporter permease [Roseobacteraceae]MBO9463983.1 AzlC family ABC transporter permease [Tropicibacter sp. R15_0]TDS95136.1 putative branched-subunit amino acid permease [Pelagimonas phthalicica]SMX26340.1 Inner membrane protein YgaZ [Pelagimonas phthalicica]